MSFMIFHCLIHKVKLGHRIIINDSFIFWSLLSSQSCLIITGLYDQLLLISADIITNYSMIQVSFTISFYFPTFEASIPHSWIYTLFFGSTSSFYPTTSQPKIVLCTYCLYLYYSSNTAFNVTKGCYYYFAVHIFNCHWWQNKSLVIWQYGFSGWLWCPWSLVYYNAL